MPHIGLPELLLILLIVVLLFGVDKIPRLGRGLGEGIKNFKESLHGKDTSPGSGEEGNEDRRSPPSH